MERDLPVDHSNLPRHLVTSIVPLMNKHELIAYLDELGEALDTALLLHGSLPSDGYASQRALSRLASYQAKARAYHSVAFLRNLRKALGRPPLQETEVPGNLVRDIGLPRFSHG
jgi:hypothetical protein